jgi:hypothetical protein
LIRLLQLGSDACCSTIEHRGRAREPLCSDEFALGSRTKPDRSGSALELFGEARDLIGRKEQKAVTTV